ncbi:MULTISPECIES: DUF3397 domain-containing protein [Alkalihalophilus]|jgi:hypothetical protein|uniref:DUF3397 domain-containing protein n=3 Tax=Alkalihalophilus TaxID=2893060 RepID=D3FU14_ALKPO|nr:MULTISPECIES: DUF3397 domain-containing protein [Alkalihalophilus]ADC48216.1 hypothetical protein BpOF4_00735 [Alkalihalophilus pseudofirmus OF4]ERN53245.1 hypothetical protein A33I_12915 [Alkalihalophilus marmarensis DSM 21297]MCM3489690.1 DUF3397 domain-containing protein [Alkalihalophilus marmarensis]MDV2885383.1 DUF3397 domain-containing protein [Alkalihalophilus pseudofirmus]MEC2072997.1 DUF3397 domain-containing protein [Alkalihalophilus marmarensis]
MTTAFAWLLATVITLPLLGWYIFYIVTVKMTKNKSRAIRLASDVSVLFFVAAVYFIILEIWSRSFFWLLLTVFFLVALIFTIIHWKVAEDIHVRKLFKGIWRFNFLLFFFLYLVLSGYGLITRLIYSL